MKLGILGTGMIVKDLLTIIHQFDFSYIAILGMEQSRKETEELVIKYALDKAYYDYDELLKDDLDVIYVALPNHLHYEFAKKALENNKHVIIEKPITSHAGELEDLMRIATQNHLMIFEAMNIHYLPAYLSLKENLHQVGNIKIVHLNYSQYSSRYSAFQEGHILPAFDYTKSGGALMDINVYNINAIIGLFGVPSHVDYHANIERQIDTSGIMIYDYPHFKALSIGAKDCQAPIVSTIQGDQGVIVMKQPINQLHEYVIIDNQGHQTTYTFDKNQHRLFYEFQEFVRMIEEKDYQKQQDMLQLSLEISTIMEKARKKEGVVFKNDR